MKTKRAFKGKPKIPHFDEEIKTLQQKYAEIPTSTEAIKRFTDLPLSQKTLKGLADSKYAHPTPIQLASIGPALQGKDILGAAQTGSGKTLAFLIPVLEHLFINKWSRTDGVGAIIISPTRELAYQIFETLKKVGRYHDFSCGLIIGGKNLKFERKRMDQCNILICTPGRLLQHMDENQLFNATTMEVFVLDEADRCLDMGFEKTLNAIVENFPPQRQTLLFSATQTNSVRDLVRLNLTDPVYVGYKQQENGNTLPAVPELLQQNYVVVSLEDKITMLWSFIKNHLKQKIIVFLTSCKQVKYIYEIFCKLRPGTSLLALYGTLHQDRRIAIYNDFVRKSNVVLFATDIASRGLDFPAVSWVVQLDCPEDVTQYIHRAGRSARNKARGESLLVLMPTEEQAMMEQLGKQNISVRQIHIDPKKLFSPRAKMEAFLAQNPELKASAQRSFISYLKSIYLMRNKPVFNVTQLDFDAYAKSLGLAVTPRVRFLERFMRKSKLIETNGNTKEITADSSNDKSDSENDDVEEAPQLKRKISKDPDFNLLRVNSDSEEEDGNDFIRLKRANHDIKANEELDTEEPLPLPVPRKKDKLVTKAALAKKAIKKKLQVNDKRKFNEEGEEIVDSRKQLQSALAKQYDEQAASDGGIDISLAKQLLSEEDKYDKQRFRELVKQRHKQRKEKLKNRDDEEQGEEDANSNDDGDSDDNDDDDDNDDVASDSENSVDLSFLPDPNKIYKNSAGDESGSEQSGVEDGDDDDADVEMDRQSHFSANISFDEDGGDLSIPPVKKRKITSKLSLDEAELIAKQLLAKTC